MCLLMTSFWLQVIDNVDRMNFHEMQHTSAQLTSSRDKVEHLLRALNSDVNALKDGRYQQADQMQRRLESSAPYM